MRVRCTLTGLAIAATAAMATYPAQAFNSWTPVPHSFFGMTMMHSYNWPSVSIGAVGKGSCVDWPYVETSNGHYNWGTLDSYVNAAASHGVDLTYSFDGVPYWAASNKSYCHTSGCSGIQICQSMPSDINTFRSYVSALVSRYRGRIKSYELWNEPYQEHGFSVSNMVTLTSNAYNIIRATDSGAKIISPSMESASSSAVSYAKSYFASGGPRGVDIASIHAYPNNYSSSADQPEGLMPNRYLLINILPVISQYLPGKPLWDTEGSWNLDNVGNYTSTYNQAAFIARWYLLHWSNGFSRTYWYAWDSPTWGTMMPSMRGSSTPANAYQQIQNWMYGRTMSSPCTMQSNGTTWTCALAGSNGYKGLVVWNTSGSTSYHPSSSSTYHQKRDLAGNVSYYAGSSGASVTIGIQPILLEN